MNCFKIQSTHQSLGAIEPNLVVECELEKVTTSALVRDAILLLVLGWIKSSGIPKQGFWGTESPSATHLDAGNPPKNHNYHLHD